MAPDLEKNHPDFWVQKVGAKYRVDGEKNECVGLKLTTRDALIFLPNNTLHSEIIRHTEERVSTKKLNWGKPQ